MYSNLSCFGHKLLLTSSPYLFEIFFHYQFFFNKNFDELFSIQFFSKLFYDLFLTKTPPNPLQSIPVISFSQNKNTTKPLPIPN